MTVYPNLIVLLNFLVDFLLLLGASCLCGYPAQMGKAALGALTGAVYTGLCLLPSFRFLANGGWRLVSLSLMAMLAYGCCRSALRRGAVFLFLCLAMGGLAMLLGRGDLYSMLLCALILCLLCILGFRGGARPHQYVPVVIRHGDACVNLTALVDTGNTLCDPVSGRPVLVADDGTGEALLGLSQQQLSDPVQTLTACRIPGLRLIPYCAVGQPSGLLLGLKVDRLTVNGKISDSLVAFAPQRLGRGEDYQALAGGMV